jgi:hypothetical protein
MSTEGAGGAGPLGLSVDRFAVRASTLNAGGAVPAV